MPLTTSDRTTPSHTIHVSLVDPHAVIGGNAVRAWVAQADESAVRNIRDVDIILNRQDRDRSIEAMQQAGCRFRVVKGMSTFLDGPEAKPWDAVRVLYAKTRFRLSDVLETPSVEDSRLFGEIRVIELKALVEMKLNANRDKDRMHVTDLIDVGLVDDSWLKKLQPPLASRLQEILENPEDESLEIDTDSR